MKISFRTLGTLAVMATLACAAFAQQAQQQQGAAQRQQQGAQNARQGGRQKFGQQQQGGQQRVTANRASAAPGSPQYNDEVIADWVAIDNETEIALAKLLASKTDNDKVRDFANQLVKNHEQYLKDLERFGVRPVELQARAPGNQEGRNATAENRQNQTAQDPNQVNTAARNNERPHNGQPLNFLSIKREIAEACLATAQQEVNKKDEHHDKFCVGMQIGLHDHLIDELKVLRQYASSPELQQTLDKGIQVSEHHLQEAKDLMRKLTSNDSKK